MVLNEQQRRKLAYYAKVELANRSFEDYFKLSNAARVPPAQIFPHTHYICEHLQKIVDGERKFYIVEMPPQTGKSMTITETFPLCSGILWPFCTAHSRPVCLLYPYLLVMRP